VKLIPAGALAPEDAESTPAENVSEVAGIPAE